MSMRPFGESFLTKLKEQAPLRTGESSPMRWGAATPVEASPWTPIRSPAIDALSVYLWLVNQVFKVGALSSWQKNSKPALTIQKQRFGVLA